MTETIDSPQTLQEAKAAQLKQTIEDAIERLADQLAQGHTGEYRQLLAFWSRFHRYSHANVLLILSQRPDATQVAGYSTWRRLGRQVRKGARAISIWCPIIQRVEDSETGEPIEQCVGFTPCPVFPAEDLVDIATNPLPTPWRPLPDDATALYGRLRYRVELAGYPIEEAILPYGVQGSTSPKGTIMLSAGLDSRNRVFVLLHELAHQLEHINSQQREVPLGQRELEAESAAAIVAGMLGLEHPTARDYILTYKGSPEGLRQSLGIIHRLVGRMTTILHLDELREALAVPQPAA